MIIFNQLDLQNPLAEKKINFLQDILATAPTSGLKQLIDSLSKRYPNLNVEFTEKSEPSVTSQNTLKIPQNLSLDDTIFYFFKMLCFFDTPEMIAGSDNQIAIGNYNHQNDYANAMLKANYAIEQRVAKVMLEIIDANEDEITQKIKAIGEKNTLDEDKKELANLLKQSFEEYELSHAKEAEQFQNEWLRVENTSHELSDLQRKIKKLSYSNLKDQARLAELSMELNRSKKQIADLSDEIRTIYSSLEALVNKGIEENRDNWKEIESYLNSLKKTGLPSTYMFAQQRDASCMLMPFINLPIIQGLQKQEGRLKFYHSDWYTKEEWLIKTFPALRDWHLAMSKLSIDPNQENNAFYLYQKDMLENGLMKEKISSLLTNEYKDYINPEGREGIKRNYFTPYLLSHENQFHMLTKYLPLYLDKGKLCAYDPDQKDYIVLESKDEMNIKKGEVIQLDSLNLPENLLQYYGINSPYLIAAGPAFGRDIIFKTSYINPDLSRLTNSDQGYFYSCGLYHLMIFAMGVDSQNNPIKVNHPLYEAYSEFRKVMAEYPNNPWNSKSFKKENFLEYHIAEILKQNPDLKENIKKTLSSFTAWPYYEELDNVLQGKDIKRHLPAEEQMLAFSISQNLKYLWALSLSKDKFSAVLELDSLHSEDLKRINVEKIISSIKAEALKADPQGNCFLDHWETLQSKLQQRVGENANLVSFDGHGSIKSFSPSVCKYQQQQGLEDETLYGRLHYTEVDSFYQEGCQPFYERTAKDLKEMNEAAKKIQRFFRSKKITEKRPKSVLSQQPLSSDEKIDKRDKKNQMSRK